MTPTTEELLSERDKYRESAEDWKRQRDALADIADGWQRLAAELGKRITDAPQRIGFAVAWSDCHIIDVPKSLYGKRIALVELQR